MAEDAEVGGNGDGGDDKIVKRSPPSKNVEQIYRDILPPNAPKKDEFPFIVLAIVEALSSKHYLNDYERSLQAC